MQMDMRHLLGHKAIIGIAILYTIALTLGSLVRPVSINNAPTNIDKLLHAGAYFGLTLLWIFWIYGVKIKQLQNLRYKSAFYVALCAIGYGIVIEYLQGALTSYRTPDGWDIVANAAGAILALIVCIVYINKSEMLKSKF